MLFKQFPYAAARIITTLTIGIKLVMLMVEQSFIEIYYFKGSMLAIE